MSPQPPATRLVHVPVRLRVTVDRATWGEHVDRLEDDVRDHVVAQLREDPLIHSVRRDEL
jgi:hypothetical protein